MNLIQIFYSLFKRSSIAKKRVIQLPVTRKATVSEAQILKKRISSNILQVAFSLILSRKKMQTQTTSTEKQHKNSCNLIKAKKEFIPCEQELFCSKRS